MTRRIALNTNGFIQDFFGYTIIEEEGKHVFKRQLPRIVHGVTLITGGVRACRFNELPLTTLTRSLRDSHMKGSAYRGILLGVWLNLGGLHRRQANEIQWLR